MITLDECLRGVSSVAIAGHIRPDGDSVGSCLALINYMRENNPTVKAEVYLEPIPAKFSFLKGADRILDPRNADGDRTYDLFFCLDCGEEGRLGDAAVFFRTAKKTVCVDHHLTNGSFADRNEVDPAASSTAELLYRMLDPAKISEAVAECLYVGIAHDTGIFRYPCTSPETMRIAADLMAKGIPFTGIVEETYAVRTFAQQQIWGKAFSSSRLLLDGKCISCSLSRDDMDACGVNPEDLDNLVSDLRVTDGVEVAILLYELSDGYKMSLRSASYVDVARIAKKFGGGGHARAAGASPDGTPEEILSRLLPEIEKQL